LNPYHSVGAVFDVDSSSDMADFTDTYNNHHHHNDHNNNTILNEYRDKRHVISNIVFSTSEEQLVTLILV